MKINWEGRKNCSEDIAQKVDAYLIEEAERFPSLCLSDEDLLHFAYLVDPQIVHDVLFKCEVEAVDYDLMIVNYDQNIDGDDDPINICGFEYFPSEILKSINEQGYEDGLLQFTENYFDLSEFELPFPPHEMGRERLYCDKEEFKLVQYNQEFRSAIQEQISESCPVLRARIEASIEADQLKSNTQEAAGAWCPSPQQADDFADRMTTQAQGNAQSQGQRQSQGARARL